MTLDKLTNPRFMDDQFNLFKGILSPPPMLFNHTSTAKYNIYKSDTAYFLEVDMLGVDKDLIQVELSGDKLSVNVGRAEEANKIYIRRDFYDRKGKTLSLKLSDEIDKENVKSSMENGILRVTLPFNEKEENSKVINIE